MAETREPSHPPAEPLQSGPRSSNASKPLPATPDRPVRIQLFVALLLGLVLVATALYLWRRPRSGADEDKAAASASSSPSPESPSFGTPPPQGTAATLAAAADAGSSNGLSLSDPRVLGCQDKGKRVSADDCDHVAPVEQALARAIEQSAACVPTSAGGGTIEYVAEVTFAKKKKAVTISLPKGGRSMKNAKALNACQSAVKHTIADLSVDGVAHNHAKYKIAITATYPGALKGH